ncbi:hypothetical protein BDP27DRAFT_1428834 [Rhodocollybia butyracea]|uniref:Uncharacterized protein n=1 Tax=Rhodocollybia butyracea TaxID=206335 RepID=A0A9P5PG80_9AGAR|nr:hypothetical protein BDP27DRAFT_1428834 [Rhodocollybia butyracea]
MNVNGFEANTNDSNFTEAEGLFDNPVDFELSELSNHGEEEPDSDTASDSVDAIIEQTEAVLDELLESNGPAGAARLHFLALASSEIPVADGDIQHTLRVIPGIGDNAMHLVDANGDIVEHRVLGKIAESDSSPYNPNRVGPYLDMIGPRDKEVFTDNMRRAKAKFLLEPLDFDDSPYPKAQVSINQARAIFDLVIAYKTEVHSKFIKSTEERDSLLYPDGIPGKSFVVQGVGAYCMPIITGPVFTGVPKNYRRGEQVTANALEDGKLKPFEQSQQEHKAKLLEAFSATTATKDTARVTVANWPDPSGFICSLGSKVDLSEVWVNLEGAAVFSAKGELVHPIDFPRYLRPGTNLAIKVQTFLWNITKDAKDRPVNNPTRHCSNLATEIHIIPDYKDVRTLYHRHVISLHESARQKAEEKRIAEEKRKAAQTLAADRSKLASAKTAADVERTNDRLARIRSLYSDLTKLSKQPQPSSSSDAVASSSKRKKAPTPPPTDDSLTHTKKAKTLSMAMGSKATSSPSTADSPMTRSKARFKLHAPGNASTDDNGKGKSKAIDDESNNMIIDTGT